MNRRANRPTRNRPVKMSKPNARHVVRLSGNKLRRALKRRGSVL